MYRLMKLSVIAADDSNVQQVAFDRSAAIWKTADLEVAAPTIRVAPADSQVQVTLGSISNGKFIAIFADYPIMFRLNGSSATQFTFTTANVPATNVGAPLPAQCAMAGNFNITSLYVQPIASAAQTANVWICCAGDPTNDYT